MTLALAEAARAAEHGDIPIGAIVLDADGTVIAAAHNHREHDQDPTAHAEIIALRAASKQLDDWRLSGCTIVVTMEPCPMCAGAIGQSRIDTVIFGAWNDEYGAAGSRWELLRDPRLAHRPQVLGGVLADACGTLVRACMNHLRSERGGMPDGDADTTPPA